MTEHVLLQYIQFLGHTGIPLSVSTIGLKVEALSGKKISKGWILCFIRRNPDCTLGQPAQLDPLRAQSFNFTTVDTYFKKLQLLFDNGQIPWENVYNLDEIGIQLGGG